MKKQQMTMTRLSKCTGFPLRVLVDFAERGLLPRGEGQSERQGESSFDGLTLLRRIGEIEDAE